MAEKADRHTHFSLCHEPQCPSPEVLLLLSFFPPPEVPIGEALSDVAEVNAFTSSICTRMRSSSGPRTMGYGSTRCRSRGGRSRCVWRRRFERGILSNAWMCGRCLRSGCGSRDHCCIPGGCTRCGRGWRSSGVRRWGRGWSC